jgi:hypothetical protein
MPKRQPKRIRRELTPEEKQRWSRAIEKIESQKAEIVDKGRRIKSAHHRANAVVRNALERLKEERKDQW